MATCSFHQWTWNFGVLRAVPSFLLGMLAFQLRDALGQLPLAGVLDVGAAGPVPGAVDACGSSGRCCC